MAVNAVENLTKYRDSRPTPRNVRQTAPAQNAISHTPYILPTPKSDSTPEHHPIQKWYISSYQQSTKYLSASTYPQPIATNPHHQQAVRRFLKSVSCTVTLTDLPEKKVPKEPTPPLGIQPHAPRKTPRETRAARIKKRRCPRLRFLWWWRLGLAGLRRWGR